jgi:hypothetical protein
LGIVALPNELTYEKGCEAIHLTGAEDLRGGAFAGKVMGGSTRLVTALSFARHGQVHRLRSGGNVRHYRRFEPAKQHERYNLKVRPDILYRTDLLLLRRQHSVLGVLLRQVSKQQLLRPG